MSNIHFGVGPVGGGGAELFGYIVQQGRDPSKTAFKYPHKGGAGLCFLWVGANRNIDGIAEAKYLKDNNIELNYDLTLAMIKRAMSNNVDASDWYIGGIGVSLFVDRLMQDFPDAIVYFTKRTDPADAMRAVEYRANVAGYEMDDSFKEYMASLNARLTEIADAKVAELGYQWTEGNSKVISEGFALGSNPVDSSTIPNTGINEMEQTAHADVIFLTPTQLAIYKPSLDINFINLV